MVFQLHRSISAVLGVFALSFSASAQGPAIKTFPLDPRSVYEIPVSIDAPTTLMFPSPLTAIEGANVTTRPETPASVLLSYVPGRNFFSVRATEANAKAAVNVVWKNQTFVIRFISGAQPFGSVTFYEDDTGMVNTGGLHRRVSAESLIGLLDRAKNFGVLSAQYPQAVQQIERDTPGTITLYKDFKVTLEEVFRFDPEDSLVFRLKFENTSEKDLFYQPQRLAARIGAYVYYASVSDASGIVPAKGTTVGYFAITGTPRGGRANLSVKNSFNIIVTRVERDAKLIVPQ